MNDRKITSGLFWYCECTIPMEATFYPIDLTKDYVDIRCTNLKCKYYKVIVRIKLRREEVIDIV